MQCALSRSFAVDGFALHQREDAAWGVCKDFDETVAGVLPHLADDCIRREPKTSINQTNVTPGSAMTHCFGLKHTNRSSILAASSAAAHPVKPSPTTTRSTDALRLIGGISTCSRELARQSIEKRFVAMFSAQMSAWALSRCGHAPTNGVAISIPSHARAQLAPFKRGSVRTDEQLPSRSIERAAPILC